MVALAIPATALPKLGAMRDIGEGILPEAARGSVREIIKTVTRHALNFRKEVPLTDEQRQKVAAVLESHRGEVRVLVERGRSIREAYAEAVKTHGPDSKQTLEAAEQIGSLARDRALLFAKISGETRPLLTAEQQNRLEAARQEIGNLVDAAIAAAK
ncbi:hypothetical protein EI77_01513 [Prosthecobacter fusiformis]|uniref:Spy/CpxP family protein refolding chaperone n=2 Tax=Prosthecobacter fusiformis TaxID=48464 RepID=A0A4R7S5W1_9BACT|nr:hypothetical protein EI77_01513 [Prosthecobacter fusiformis]